MTPPGRRKWPSLAGLVVLPVTLLLPAVAPAWFTAPSETASPEASPVSPPSTPAVESARPPLSSGSAPQLRCPECHAIPPEQGAHRAHATVGAYEAGFDCSTCHYVERFPDLHDNGRVDVRFHPGLPGADDARYESGTCADVYCHSDGRERMRPVAWADGTDLDCDGCHATTGSPEEMSGRHAFHLNSGVTCASCHADVVDLDGAIIDHDQHVDGDVDVRILVGDHDPGGGSCMSGCHQLHERRPWRDGP